MEILLGKLIWWKGLIGDSFWGLNKWMSICVIVYLWGMVFKVEKLGSLKILEWKY